MFRGLEARGWWQALLELEAALEGRDAKKVRRSYAWLVAELVAAGYPSPAAAAVDSLLEGESALASVTDDPLPGGLREAALLDLEMISRLVGEEWHTSAEAAVKCELPRLDALGKPRPELEDWERLLERDEPGALLGALLNRYRTCGTGMIARFTAFRWVDGELEGIARPAADSFEELVGLERQTTRLCQNVERFLRGRPALHTLLYGPRGSGKSSAVRSLLGRYAGEGLRLIEVSPAYLPQLARLAEAIRERPHRYVAFVDDLSFEAGEGGHRPLRTLLEGSLSRPPSNLLIVATSNRRHLVRERLSDRPLPEDDDVHSWDTFQESLALADRFGLVITFPTAQQRSYLEIVRQLVAQRGLNVEAEALERDAISFAERGNGYSGRTARQFVDTLD